MKRRITAAAVLLASFGLLAGVPPVVGPVAADEVPGPPGGGSALTVSGRPGSFDDFSNLQITVSQTQNLTNQAVTITWAGGTPTPRNRLLGVDYLQIMQCWGQPGAEPGDAADLAFRETCQFGTQLAVPSPVSSGGAVGLNSNRRLIVPSEGSLPRDPDETLPADAQMVPFETAAGQRTPDGGSADPLPQVVDPQTGATRQAVPEEVLAEFFTPFTTNEVPYAITAADGTGRAVFELQNAILAPHLGCGGAYTDQTGASQPARPCTLVVVPRGSHDPFTGADVSATGAVHGSPFTPAVWRNRITVPLAFDPVSGLCPLGQTERRTAGSELVAEAMVSWQPTLCAGNGPVFGFAGIGDAEAARQVVSSSPGAPGMVFTADPVVPDPGEPAVVQAPVVLSGAVIAINIDARLETGTLPADVDVRRGQLIPEIKLNQRLVAKLLTQSYRRDVPDGRQADYLADNPDSIKDDPEFLELNKDYDDIFSFWDQTPSASPDGLMVSLGNFAAAQEVWRWILADPQARSWVTGQGDDGHGMIVNKYYKDLFASAPDSFPKADPTCAVGLASKPVESRYCTLDLRPYQNSLSAAAYQTLRADAGVKITYDPLKLTPGLNADPPKPPGFRWAMSITDAASAARYGLFTARLRNQAGEYVLPTTESLLAGAAAMVPSDVAGVKTIDPTKSAPGAYPLTMVTYAVADTSEQADARRDYANFLRYAAGPGQQSGEARGDLPDGYVPLPQDMRQQTLQAADTLERWVSPPSPTPENNDAGAPPGNNNAPPGNPPPATTQAAPPTGTPAAGAPPVPAPTTPGSAAPSATPVGQRTPGSPLGAIRWVLLAALAAGLAAAIGGPVLHRFAEGQSRKDGPSAPP